MGSYNIIARARHKCMLLIINSLAYARYARALQLFALTSRHELMDPFPAVMRMRLFALSRRKYQAALNLLHYFHPVRPLVRMKPLDALISRYGGEQQFASAMNISPQRCAELAHFFLGDRPIVLANRKGSIDPVDAMAITWYRLHNQGTVVEAQLALGCDESKISAVFAQVCYTLSAQFFRFLEQPPWVTEPRRFLYDVSIAEAGCPFSAIIGFIDGVRFDIARPSEGQTEYYTRYTRSHNLLFLAIVFPDGTLSMHGPVVGRHNDLGALVSLGLVGDGLRAITGDKHFLGGDGIFAQKMLNTPIITMANTERPGAQQQSFSKCRISVEWLFNVLYQLFPALHDWHKLKLFDFNTPAHTIRAASVLALAHNTIERNCISQAFCLLPPPLEELFLRGDPPHG